MNLGPGYPVCPQMHAAGRLLQSLSPNPRPNSSSTRGGSSRLAGPARTRTERKSRAAIFSLLSVHPIPTFVPPVHTSGTKTQNPLLYFQQLTRSSAIRWGWGVGSRRHRMLSRAKRGICFFFAPFPDLFRHCLFSISFRIRTCKKQGEGIYAISYYPF